MFGGMNDLIAIWKQVSEALQTHLSNAVVQTGGANWFTE